MFFSDQKWLDGWRVFCDDRLEPEKLFDAYKKECEILQEAGKEFFASGVLPSLAGTGAPEEYQKGTGGNFAIRKKGEKRFLVTARGAHKGYLQRSDFAVVHHVDWQKQNICITSLDNFSHLPSTDSLLIAAAFAAEKNICVWIHFHEVIDTPYKIHLAYPALTHGDRNTLAYAIRSGIHEMNMVDHDLYRKIRKDNTADSSIIVGSDPEETIFRAHTLLERARCSKKAG